MGERGVAVAGASLVGIDGATEATSESGRDSTRLGSGACPLYPCAVELHPPFLTGRLVRLRAPEPADDSLNELFNDHGVRSGLGMPFPQPKESFRDWIESARKDPEHISLVIERLEEPGAIGMCDLMRIEAPTRVAELGIWVARPWWRGGYGTDAVRTLSRFGFDELLTARGAVLAETLDVLAVDLAAGVPDLGAHHVELRWTIDVPTLRDSYGVLTTVFGGDVPPDEQLRIESDQAATTVAGGQGGGVVAYVEGEPVGTGGVTVAGDVTRLWSGSVVAQHRGAGVYRALLDVRLRYGLDHGSTMGLVKGRLETSGPILRRAGFAAYGQERSYRIGL